MSNFRKELEQLINRNSKESGSDTPDFVLAEFLNDSLMAFDKATKLRGAWYGGAPSGDSGGGGMLGIPMASEAQH